jgi:hypothetical protein
MGSLIHVTAWERVSPWRRVLAAFVRATILFLVVFVLAHLAYGKRYQLAAKIWHWRHGYSTRLGYYDVPVPEHWFPNQDSGVLSLVNTAPAVPRRDERFHTTAVVTLFPSRGGPVVASQMEFWLSLQRQRLEREGVKSVAEKRVGFDDEDVVCIGDGELSAMMRDEKAFPDTSVISLSCMSDHGLNILFIGGPSDLQPFYTFVSQIRRHG